MTSADAAELVAMLSAAFPNARLSERTCRVYESMLSDLDFEASKRAASRIICTAKFMPTVAEIRAAVAEQTHGPRRTGGESWGDVAQAVRRFGRYQTPEFEDPTVAECVRQMGWLYLCSSGNEAADRARFIELYDALAVRERANLVSGQALALPAPNVRQLGKGIGR